MNKNRNYSNLPYDQYRIGHISNVQTLLTSYSSARLLDLLVFQWICRACGLCFLFNREEPSICVGIRAEGTLSSCGPDGVRTTRENQVFIVAVRLAAFAMLTGYSRS